MYLQECRKLVREYKTWEVICRAPAVEYGAPENTRHGSSRLSAARPSLQLQVEHRAGRQECDANASLQCIETVLNHILCCQYVIYKAVDSPSQSMFEECLDVKAWAEPNLHMKQVSEVSTHLAYWNINHINSTQSCTVLLLAKEDQQFYNWTLWRNKVFSVFIETEWETKSVSKLYTIVWNFYYVNC